MQYGSHIRVWRGCYYHHGVYVGDGKFVHASGSTVGVVISSLDSAYYIEHYHGARRMA